jgi:hypothetical protein
MLLLLRHHRLFTWDSEEKNSQHLLLLLLMTTLQKLQQHPKLPHLITRTTLKKHKITHKKNKQTTHDPEKQALDFL